MANKLQQNLSLAKELLGGSRPLRRSGATPLSLEEELLGGSDKLTIQDYLDYFGEKSAMSDDVLDQLFGTIKSRGDYMESQRGQTMTPEMMQLIMGAVEPGGGIKTAGKAVAKGGKNILDILRELLGRGKPEMGDVMSGFKRRSQPSEFLTKTTPGQQQLFQDYISGATKRISEKKALKLTPQDLPTQGQVFPNLKQSPISRRTPEQNVVRNIMKAIDRQARESGARSSESYFYNQMGYETLIDLLKKAGK